MVRGKLRPLKETIPLTPNTKRTALFALVGVLILAAIGAGLYAFGKKVGTPDQHNPARFGVVQVYLPGSWEPAERARILAELPRLNRLGPLFEPYPADRPEPQVIWDRTRHVQVAVILRGDWGPDSCRMFGIGNYNEVTHLIHVDPVCGPGDALASAAAHELGHFLGMGHVCRSAGESRDFRCSPVGYDPDSIMNPAMSLDGGDSGSSFVTGLPPLSPSFKDLEEFLRARSDVDTSLR